METLKEEEPLHETTRTPSRTFSHFSISIIIVKKLIENKKNLKSHSQRHLGLFFFIFTNISTIGIAKTPRVPSRMYNIG